jgi:hypothetical protein
MSSHTLSLSSRTPGPLPYPPPLAGEGKGGGGEGDPGPIFPSALRDRSRLALPAGDRPRFAWPGRQL